MVAASALLFEWPAVKRRGRSHWQAEIASLLGLIWTEFSSDEEKNKTKQEENPKPHIFSTSWKPLKPEAIRGRQ